MTFAFWFQLRTMEASTTKNGVSVAPSFLARLLHQFVNCDADRADLATDLQDPVNGFGSSRDLFGCHILN